MWKTFWLKMFCFSNTVFDLISIPYQYSFRRPLSTCVWFMGRFFKKQNMFSWFFLVEFLHRSSNSWAQSHFFFCIFLFSPFSAPFFTFLISAIFFCFLSAWVLIRSNTVFVNVVFHSGHATRSDLIERNGR